eukprot:7322423-Prymnesium_polylepis.2
MHHIQIPHLLARHLVLGCPLGTRAIHLPSPSVTSTHTPPEPKPHIQCRTWLPARRPSCAQVLSRNEGVRLPAEALYVIRYHSLYPWHDRTRLPFDPTPSPRPLVMQRPHTFERWAQQNRHQNPNRTRTGALTVTLTLTPSLTPNPNPQP